MSERFLQIVLNAVYVAALLIVVLDTIFWIK